MAWLQDELENYGLWLNYDNDIGPKPPRCTSIECRHLAELGDVMEEEPETPRPIPNVASAERLHRHVRQLQRLEQLALAIRYAGMPAVFRRPRASQYTLEHLADNAEIMLANMMERFNRASK